MSFLLPTKWLIYNHVLYTTKTKTLEENEIKSRIEVTRHHHRLSQATTKKKKCQGHSNYNFSLCAQVNFSNRALTCM